MSQDPNVPNFSVEPPAYVLESEGWPLPPSMTGGRKGLHSYCADDYKTEASD